MRPAIPDRTFLIPLLLRGLVLWLLLRACFAVLAWLLDGAEGSIAMPARAVLGPLPANAALWLLLIATALGMLDLRRRNEHLLLANFGVHSWVLALLCGTPVVAGELVIFWRHAAQA
jgi:hypothetical protein